MELDQDSSQAPLPQTRSAPMTATPGFKLQTVGAANLAWLELDTAGRVFLYFRGIPYGVDDYVPNSLLRGQLISPSGTAGEFVCRQMLTRYGYRENEWPDLARRFLLAHATCLPDRSRHKS